ncbi:alkyl hydroperoxide reductase [Gracilaria domingensis]|nr:alkyl hydroperoxide reductase [Gracilaria domingensis]
MLPADFLAEIQRTSEELEKLFTPTPLQLGDTAPDFTLNDALGKPVKLSDLLEEHNAVVVTWYRGVWCPYCNATLDSLILANDHIEALGAKLVTISAQTPDESVEMIEEMQLPFHVLSDDYLKVAEKYGIAFTVTDGIKNLYNDFGVDLDAINGNERKRKARLPVPATFVLDKSGKVRFAYADMDYTTRAEPQDVVEAIQAIVEDAPSE